MKLTTGYDFQGYFITEYKDVIFDEMLVGLGFGKSILSGFDNMLSALTGSEATEMIDKLNAVKQQLRDRVVRKAKSIGANALIGIDFESSKLGDLIMVSMTATAVVIDKIISPLPQTQKEQEKAQEKANEELRREEEKKLKEKKVEEIRQLLEQKQDGIAFNFVQFYETLVAFKSSKEMKDLIHQAAEERPDLFGDEIVLKADRYARQERIYGQGTGREEIIQAVKEWFGL